jgi:hypothetical protein
MRRQDRHLFRGPCLQPVKIKIPYGETVLPRGGKFQIVSGHDQTIIIQYMDGTYAIPIGSTDLR